MASGCSAKSNRKKRCYRCRHVQATARSPTVGKRKQRSLWGTAILAIAVAAAAFVLRPRVDTCPVCATEENSKRILYGCIKPGSGYQKDRKYGGSPVIIGKSPVWHCNTCGSEWGAYLRDPPWWQVRSETKWCAPLHPWLPSVAPLECKIQH